MPLVGSRVRKRGIWSVIVQLQYSLSEPLIDHLEVATKTKSESNYHNQLELGCTVFLAVLQQQLLLLLLFFFNFQCRTLWIVVYTGSRFFYGLNDLFYCVCSAQTWCWTAWSPLGNWIRSSARKCRTPCWRGIYTSIRGTRSVTERGCRWYGHWPTSAARCLRALSAKRKVSSRNWSECVAGFFFCFEKWEKNEETLIRGRKLYR